MSTVSEIELARDGLIQAVEEIFPDAEILIDPVLSDDLRIRIVNTLYSPTLDKNRRTNPIMVTFGADLIDDYSHLSSAEKSIYKIKIRKYIQHRVTEYEAGIDRPLYANVEVFYISIPTIL